MSYFILVMTTFFVMLGNDFPVLKGAYLGQDPPGMEPEIFAPGIISTGESEGCSVFSPDGKELTFNKFRESKTFIYITRQSNGFWSKPELAPFSSDYYDGDFTLSPDGKKLFYSSARPLEEGGEPTRPSNLWIVEKTDSGWTSPRALSEPINTEHHESYPTVTSNGTLYFFARDRGGLGRADLFVSRWVDGKYTEVENLGAPINTEFDEYDPFVAPDESYLIFVSSRPGSLGKDDLYISFKKDDGSWSPPVHMGNGVNSAASENRPYVTPDNKYFFFTSNRESSIPGLEHLGDEKRPGNGSRDIYWVDSKVLERFKP
jgi:Tol biopolymer transport system component